MKVRPGFVMLPLGAILVTGALNGGATGAEAPGLGAGDRGTGGGEVVEVAGETEGKAEGSCSRGVAGVNIPNRLGVQAIDAGIVQQNIAAKKLLDAVTGKGVVSGRKLHVVYVSFAERPPLPRHVERWTDILHHIQAFYADQMEKQGYGRATFALDMDQTGKVRLHEARIDKKLSEVEKYSAGNVTREAAFAVLREAGIDPERNHVLIICQLPDGVSPYYGGGNHKAGIAWVCDMAHLEPARLTDKTRDNHRFDRTTGQDNSVYIGGTAHELGHAFGLPHNREDELNRARGVSLMGSGNYTYGAGLRGEARDSFLSQSDAAQLASVPLFSGKEVSPEAATSSALSRLTIAPVKEGFRLKARVSAEIPVYGVLGYIDPLGNQDYDATSAVAVPDPETGEFELEMTRSGVRGIVGIKLVALHGNGAISKYEYLTRMTAEGVECAPVQQAAFFEPLARAWQQGNTAEARGILLQLSREIPAGDTLLGEGLKTWQTALEGGTLRRVELAKVASATKSVSLCEVVPAREESGWGKVLANTLPANAKGPVAWMENGPLDKFIYLHAPGALEYHLAGKWKNFSARLGLCLGKSGSVKFKVVADGQEVANTQTLHEGQSAEINVPVDGVKKLEIRVLDAGDGNTGDWAVIGSPALSR